MSAKWIKEYFSFTKKERVGIVSLLLILILVWYLPDLFPKKTEFNPKTLEALEKEADTFWRSDSINTSIRRDSPRKEIVERTLSPPFYFDPNTISAEEWQQLGAHAKLIRTIQNYLLHGGKFRKPEDLGKIYGLQKELAERLIPFVRIIPSEMHTREKPGTSNRIDATRIFQKRNERIYDIDINAADTAAWIALPGVGSKLALRIVNFREKLGGFYSVDQVSETFGLPDSVFQKLKKYFRCDSSGLKKIDLNKASLEDLKGHPYLRQNLGNAIYQYRLQHGNFGGLDELRRITVMTDDIFTKITPYLTIH